MPIQASSPYFHWEATWDSSPTVPDIPANFWILDCHLWNTLREHEIDIARADGLGDLRLSIKHLGTGAITFQAHQTWTGSHNQKHQFQNIHPGIISKTPWSSSIKRSPTANGLYIICDLEPHTGKLARRVRFTKSLSGNEKEDLWLLQFVSWTFPVKGIDQTEVVINERFITTTRDHFVLVHKNLWTADKANNMMCWLRHDQQAPLNGYTSPAAGKDLFRRENNDAIKNLATDKFKDTSALGYQRALSELWKNAQDQEDYNKRAKTIDIFKNQLKFRAAMTSALISMCQSNTLGPAEMVLLAGFRDEQNNLKCFHLHGHHDFSNSDTFPLDKQEVEKMLKAWSDHCEEHIPKHVKQEPAAKDETLLRNLNGVPVFEKLDLDDLSPKQVATDREQPSIPFTAIEANPEDFIDTKKFRFPVILKAVEMLDVDARFKLAAYLMTISSVDHPEPFTLHEKADISARVEARRVKEEAECGTGQEIIDPIAPSDTPRKLDTDTMAKSPPGTPPPGTPPPETPPSTPKSSTAPTATPDSPTPPSTLKSPTATPKSPPPTQKLSTPTPPPPPVSSSDTATIAEQGSSAHPVGPATAEDVPTVSSSLVTQGNDADQSANDNPPPPTDPSAEESPGSTNLTETATGMEVDAHAGAVVPTQLQGRKRKCKEPAGEGRNTRARVQAQPTPTPTPRASEGRNTQY
ncbi:hypothetical protein BT96DRAFT_1005887 [Gymnopus androsaceus JB14]|uniref:Uncharacterized protein n=1 Tax=Gymnopus androsaceus JB14 TaxID=1447944 RepID=A0A6A4GMW4_9AGAR|nr:hypothetical protein BT96DRAFT_1005887 [Gymnopus androsaceus JB14]